MLRPEALLAPHRQGLLLSSFRRLDRSKPASRITTRANSQFPRPDLHRQETRHYGLQAKPQRKPKWGMDFFAPLREIIATSPAPGNSATPRYRLAPARPECGGSSPPARLFSARLGAC